MPDATPEKIAEMPWLKPFINEHNQPLISIKMLIVETPEQKLVVDTCIGNDKQINLASWSNMQLPFIENLKKMGHDPDSVDTVVCTHLHVDHVGWNTTKKNGKWIPTFPNARYLAVEEEFNFWRALENDPSGNIFGESVKPVMDADLMDLVKSTHEVSTGIRFESTLGHISVHITSNEQEAIITGDVLHHTCQIGRPNWATNFDNDADQARKTRHKLLEHCVDKPILVLRTHFPNPMGGKIVRDGNTYRFDY